MTATFATLGLDHLSYEEKAELLLRLDEELDDATPAPSQGLRTELKRRLAHAKANPGESVPAEVVFSEYGE
jgi:putative addiction module component (TIGR02574 family)